MYKKQQEPKEEIDIHNKNHVEKKNEHVKNVELTEWRYAFCSHMLLQKRVARITNYWATIRIKQNAVLVF